MCLFVLVFWCVCVCLWLTLSSCLSFSLCLLVDFVLWFCFACCVLLVVELLFERQAAIDETPFLTSLFEVVQTVFVGAMAQVSA